MNSNQPISTAKLTPVKNRIFTALIMTGMIPLLVFAFIDVSIDRMSGDLGAESGAMGIGIGILTAILFAGFLSRYFLRKIFRPLAEVMEMVQALRDRDYLRLQSWVVPDSSKEIQELFQSLKFIGQEVFLHTTRLEKIVDERTEHLRHLSDDFLKKNEELIGVVEKKNEFVGMAAHDLRSPIGVIRGFCDIMITQVEPESQMHEFLSRCQSQCDFMLDLLDELLEVSELEAGKSDLMISEVSLKANTHESIGMYQSYAQKKSIRIKLEMPEKLPFLVADRRKILQIFSNLLSNAIKYSPAQSLILIRIEYLEDREVFRIGFIDQGQGIPETEIQKLFKPFSRTSVRATAGEKSTGLGLSIVARLVALHHGRVWVESAVGKGSQFFVELPRVFQKTVETSSSGSSSKAKKSA